MTKKIVKIDPKIAELEAKLARALADYSNLEKRYADGSASIVRFATSSLLGKLLEVRDHLGLASVTGDPSLKLILSSFDKILVEEGVTEVKTNGAFDPHTMECQETVPGPQDQIVKVTRPGYMLHDRVLRPARVVVGSGQLINQAK